MTLIDLPGKRLREEENLHENVKKPCVQLDSSQVQVEMTVGELREKSRMMSSNFSSPFRIVEQEPWNPYATLAVVGIRKSTVAQFLPRLVFLLALQLESDGYLVITPDPVNCFDHSHCFARKKFALHESASLVFVDWFSNNPKSDVWTFDSFFNRLELSALSDQSVIYTGQQVASNKSVVSSDEKVNIFGQTVKQFSSKVCGVVVLYGPNTLTIRNTLASLRIDPSINQAFTILIVNEQLTVVNFSVPTVQDGYELLSVLLSPLRDTLNGNQPYQQHIHYDLSHKPLTTNSSGQLLSYLRDSITA